MVRIKPLPADATFIIILEYPGESFNVCLSDILLHLVHLGVILDKELGRVVAFSIALLSKFNNIDIFLDLYFLFSLNLSGNFFFNGFSLETFFLVFGKSRFHERVFKVSLGSSNYLFVSKSTSSIRVQLLSLRTASTASVVRVTPITRLHLVSILLSGSLELLLSKEFIFNFANRLEKYVNLFEYNLTIFSQISIERRQQMLVDSQDCI